MNLFHISFDSTQNLNYPRITETFGRIVKGSVEYTSGNWLVAWDNADVGALYAALDEVVSTKGSLLILPVNVQMLSQKTQFLPERVQGFIRQYFTDILTQAA